MSQLCLDKAEHFTVLIGNVLNHFLLSVFNFRYVVHNSILEVHRVLLESALKYLTVFMVAKPNDILQEALVLFPGLFLCPSFSLSLPCC